MAVGVTTTFGVTRTTSGAASVFTDSLHISHSTTTTTTTTTTTIATTFTTTLTVVTISASSTITLTTASISRSALDARPRPTQTTTTTTESAAASSIPTTVVATTTIAAATTTGARRDNGRCPKGWWWWWHGVAIRHHQRLLRFQLWWRQRSVHRVKLGRCLQPTAHTVQDTQRTTQQRSGQTARALDRRPRRRCRQVWGQHGVVTTAEGCLGWKRLRVVRHDDTLHDKHGAGHGKGAVHKHGHEPAGEDKRVHLRALNAASEAWVPAREQAESGLTQRGDGRQSRCVQRSQPKPSHEGDKRQEGLVLRVQQPNTHTHTHARAHTRTHTHTYNTYKKRGKTKTQTKKEGRKARQSM